MCDTILKRETRPSDSVCVTAIVIRLIFRRLYFCCSSSVTDSPSPTPRSPTPTDVPSPSYPMPVSSPTPIMTIPDTCTDSLPTIRYAESSGVAGRMCKFFFPLHPDNCCQHEYSSQSTSDTVNLMGVRSHVGVRLTR